MALLRLDRAAPARAPRVPFLSLGFRPFFLGAGLFAVATMALWMDVFVRGRALAVAPLSPSQWHAHEMVYGYGMAVIAGFLLTAVENWTDRPTLRGAPLALVFGAWALARVLWLFGARFLGVAAWLDVGVAAVLSVAVLQPIIATRQWRQMAIAAKLTLLGAGQVLFALGAQGRLENGVRWGIYGGLYLVIGLIMTMGARVIPPFIQNGVDENVVIRKPAWIAVGSLVFFLAFYVSEVFLGSVRVTTAAAAALFVVTTARLALWHTPGIWKRPLLWSLYLSFVFIDLGFLLFALRPWTRWPVFVPIHALAMGGIGLVTLGMMARVSLGHSGRSVRRPPAAVGWAAGLLTLGTVVRVFLPVLDAGRYAAWIGAAQMCWILAFGLFIVSFAPVFVMRDAPPDAGA